jgi:hypothetical protein
LFSICPISGHAVVSGVFIGIVFCRVVYNPNGLIIYPKWLYL